MGAFEMVLAYAGIGLFCFGIIASQSDNPKEDLGPGDFAVAVLLWPAILLIGVGAWVGKTLGGR